MLENVRVTAFVVFELLRENQQDRGNYAPPPPPPPPPPPLDPARLGLNNKKLYKLGFQFYK